jgi:putative ABC transport system permease protein
MMGASDDAIYIPLTTLRQTVSAQRTTSGAYTVSQIIVGMTDQEYSDAVKSDITYLLESMHRLSEGEEDDFSITSQEDLVATITEATSSMTLLLGAIAAISLLVGGIGVMNIMLVSVIERTREIGIRKALGAQERDIWMQFLIEAGILTLTGGIIGVIVGWLVAFLIEHVGNTTTLVSFDIILLAITVSIAIGVFFGFYPAWQASRLNPIEALRSE